MTAVREGTNGGAREPVSSSSVGHTSNLQQTQGSYPAILSARSCISRVQDFVKAHSNTREMQLVSSACTAAHPDQVVNDPVFLLVCKIIALGHLNPAQLPNETWHILKTFNRTHNYLSSIVLPALISPNLQDDFLMFFTQFPAPFYILRQWGLYGTLMTETFNFISSFEANFAKFASLVSHRAQPPSPDEMMANFFTASDTLHYFLYGYILETCLSISVHTPFGQTQWQRYYVGLQEMKNQLIFERSNTNSNAGSPLQHQRGQAVLPPGPILASQSRARGPNVHNSFRPIMNTNLSGILPNTHQSFVGPQSPPIGTFSPPNSASVQSPSRQQVPLLPSQHQQLGVQGYLPTPNPTDTRHNSSGGQVQTGSLVGQQIKHTLKPNSFFPWPDIYAPCITPPEPSRFALHQARLLTPQLVLRDGVRRAYRYVSGFVLNPQTFNGTSATKWTFDVPFNLATLIPAQTSDEAWSIQQDSSLYRIRCVKRDVNTPEDAQKWHTSDTYWPPHVYYECNGHRLEERRKPAYGKDLPIGITSYIKVGSNSVEITCNIDKTAKLEEYYLAVERVNVAMHDLIKQNCAQRVVPRDTTIAAIAGQLNSGDEEVQMTSMTIGLCDPMLASKIWEIPTRGPTCRHREAFDLETFLQSRPSRPGDDVTTADAWKCPICGGNARPNVLLVDEWLADVRRDLDAQGRLDARAINVAANGTWTIVEESGGHKAKASGDPQAALQPANIMELDSD